MTATKKITQLTALTDPQPTDIIPIVDDPGGSPETKKMQLGYWARLQDYQRMVVVDQGGKGNFTTISGACNWVATQTRNMNNGWIILVMPGAYSEASISLPSYTTLRSFDSPGVHTDQVFSAYVNLTATSGTLITMGVYSHISDLFLIMQQTPTGALTLVGAANMATIERTNVLCMATAATYAVTLISIPGGGAKTFVNQCSLQCGAVSCANLIGIDTAGEGVIINTLIFPYSNAQVAGIGLRVTGDENLVYFSRFAAYDGTGWGTYDIQVTGGSVYVLDSPYKKYSGVINNIGRWKTTLSGMHEASAAAEVPMTVKGAAAQSANLLNVTDSTDAILFGVEADGDIRTSRSSAGTTLGAVVAKLPIYDAAGTIVGYIPIYNAIT